MIFKKLRQKYEDFFLDMEVKDYDTDGACRFCGDKLQKDEGHTCLVRDNFVHKRWLFVKYSISTWLWKEYCILKDNIFHLTHLHCPIDEKRCLKILNNRLPWIRTNCSKCKRNDYIYG